MNNPFTLSFGKKPVQYISRIAQTERIIGDFTAEESPNQIYMITDRSKRFRKNCNDD